MTPTPALFPPGDGANHTWPAPNYVDPETRGWAAPACIIALFGVTLLVFCARIRARFWISRTPGADDWLIIASMPALLGLTISTVLALRVYGFNLHIYDQTPKTNITIRQITLAMEIIYIITTTLTKISILTFYRRITSSVISRPLLIAVWASIIFVATYGIAFCFVLLFTCWPVEAYWYRFTTSWMRTHTWKCHDEIQTLLIIISLSLVQDIIACLLPMFVVHKLRLPFRQKLALAGVFLLGLVTCATGALRIHFAHRVYYFTQLHPSPTYDISWEALGSWVSTSFEANLAVICASAPALKVYWGPWFSSGESEPRTFGWYHRGREARSVMVNNDSGYVSGRASERVTPKSTIVQASVVGRAHSSSCSRGRRAESMGRRHVEHVSQ